MTSTTLTIDQLALSSFNVRTNVEDSTATDALEKSLLRRGQMMPLLVHAMKGRKDLWGVFAGGRRYRAFKNLIARGDLPRDHPVEVVIRDLGEAELLELSLSENLIRRDLRDYEICAAAVRTHRRGESIEAIAEALGQQARVVRQWVRLGELAAPVFKAFSTGHMSTDIAKAYGATADHAAQIAAFEEMERLPAHLRDAQAVRAALRVDDRELGRRLRFVGEERYREAGGVFELDLFAAEAEHRGRVADPDILARLVEERLARERDDMRRRAGRDVRFVVGKPQGPGGTDWDLRIEPERGRDGALILPEGDVVATVGIDENGDAERGWWWASRKARREAAGPAQPRRRPAGVATGEYASPGVIAHANREVRSEWGVGSEAVEILKSLRRMSLRAMMVRDARGGDDVGRDFAIWSLLKQAASDRVDPEVGAGRIGYVSADPPSVRGHLEATPAHEEWESARRLVLTRPAFQEPNAAAAFRLYRAESEQLKRLAAAIVAGVALERSFNAELYAVPVHDAIAAECGMADDAQVRELAPPTYELLDRIPREQQLELVAPFVGPDKLEAWSKPRATNLTQHVHAVLSGSMALPTKEQQLAARGWLHPLLKFQPPGAPAAEAGIELHEAAE